jgi:hypothetical protein
MTDQTAIIPAEGAYLAPAATLQTILNAYQAKKELIEKVLRVGVDFGTIPGAGDKPALKKPGAEKLVNFFGLSPVFEDVQCTEDWIGFDHSGEPFFYYRQRCKLYRGDRLIASADGSCNSWEKKYRYRQSERVCPNCGKGAIIKGKAEYGGGWVCFAKKGGCGAKFPDGDQTIEGQQVGQVKNLDVAEQVNTILKMAQKRALVAATLIATGASDYFTQDVDDFIEGEYHDPEPPKVTVKQKEPITLEEALNMRTPKGKQLNELTDEQLEYLTEHAANGLNTAAVMVLESRKQQA